MLTLLSFHSEKKVSQTSSLQIGLNKGTTSAFLDHEPVSIRKCLVGLQQEFTSTIREYVAAFCDQTQVKQIFGLVIKIVIQYPFAAKEVQKQLLASFPNHHVSLDQVLIYNRLALNMVD